VKNLLDFKIINKDWIQSRIFILSGVFLFIYSLVLTLSPAVRYHSWNVEYRWQHWVGFISWGLISFIIHRISAKKYINRDPYLLPVAFTLIGWGLLSIYRLNPGFGFRQNLWFLLSAILLAVGIYKPNLLHEIRRFKYVWLTLGILITALTFIFGIYPNGEGPRLWLGCCGFYIQPSEPLKLLFLVYLSAYLADKWPTRNHLISLITPTLVFIGAAVLILIAQRDLGTAIIFILLFAFYMYLVSGKRRLLLIFFVLILLAGFAGYQYFSVIQYRLDAWITPWQDPAGKSYQVIQSLQAVAAGGFFGTGPGIGSPGLVPVAISDFIYDVIAEETGLLGSIALFSFYVLLAYRGFLIAIQAKNQYQRLLSIGISILITIQAVLILGGNILLLPLTGVTLPFVSYGGSSLITFSFGLMLLLWISNNRSPKPLSQKEAKPYVFAFQGILVVFLILSLFSGYWAIIQSETLLARNDNLRKVINDRYVMRGQILDRNNQIISETEGLPGDYSRITNYPNLSTTIGFLNPSFGLSGIELSYDGYLRGEEGLPSSTIITNQILYAQPPAGLDIRTSIDTNLQFIVDDILKNKKGAALILNAQNGEILSIWSSPTYNSNNLDLNWETWKDDPEAPMLNRVTQGQYPIGSLITPFLTANLINQGQPDFLSKINLSNPASCVLPPEDDTINQWMRSGCSSLTDQLIDTLPQDAFSEFINLNQWNQALSLEIPVAENEQNQLIQSGEGKPQDILLSPLNIAVSAAAFSNGGYLLSPYFGMAVNTPQSGWVIFDHPKPTPLFSLDTVQQVNDLLIRTDFPVWEISSESRQEDNINAWYVSGTDTHWKGTPMVIVITLENETAETARELGRQMMNNLISGN